MLITKSFKLPDGTKVTRGSELQFDRGLAMYKGSVVLESKVPDDAYEVPSLLASSIADIKAGKSVVIDVDVPDSEIRNILFGNGHTKH